MEVCFGVRVFEGFACLVLLAGVGVALVMIVVGFACGWGVLWLLRFGAWCLWLFCLGCGRCWV